MSKKLLIIINPCSGQNKGLKNLNKILFKLSEADFEPTVCFTKETGDGRRLALENGKDYKTILVIGGDGTLNEVVSGIMQSGMDISIGYLPAGSTNDFAQSLSLPSNLLKATDRFINGSEKNLDVGLFNDRHFCYIASFGAFTKTSYNTPQNIKNALGHTAYVLEGIKELGSLKSERLRVELEGETIEGDYIFGAISNSTSIGGILKLDSDIVDMNDGLFEIILLKKPASIMELNECVQALTTKQYNSRMLTFKTASKALITAKAPLPWSLDGEYGGAAKNIKVENIKDAIKFIL